ncbi:MAG: hypothetical protein SVQ76_01520 [Candidatus Nanohaloarchaea archaeon]|nr:hypothetical protein [Candidatus Nanohaloarchaea archaeon]
MASEFVYVLVAGLTILVVGGVLAGFAGQTGTIPAESGEAIFSADIGTIGAIQSTSRSVDFGDVVVERNPLNATAKTREEVSVGSSVLGASAEIVEFEAVKPRKAYISFVPSKSSSPENLVIEVNGERLQVPDYAAGERVTVSTSNVKQGANTVRITAKKPGAAFWSTPSYTLQNFKIIVEDRANSQVIEPFRVYDYEASGFDRGELRFSVTEDVRAAEPLKIEINGNTVMERTVIKRALPYTVQFTKARTGIEAGENVLSLSTTGESRYVVDNLRMTLYYYAGTQERTVTRSFSLSPQEYREISDKGGRIRFEVEEVNLANPLTVSLPNREFTVNPTKGNNTISFGRSAVKEGKNSLTISTDGSYRISDFVISTVSDQ